MILNDHPKYYCTKCGMKESCYRHMRADFPPDAALKALKKRHKKTKCNGELKYMCGFMINNPKILNCTL